MSATFQERSGGVRAQIVGTLFAVVVILSGIGWNLFVRFLLSGIGAMVVCVAAAGSAYVLFSRVHRYEHGTSSVFSFGFSMPAFAMAVIAVCLFPLLGAILPAAYTAHFGRDVSFETTVEKKIKTLRRFTIRIRESAPLYARNPNIDQWTWDRIGPGSKVTIVGKQTLLGISISEIRIKR